MHEDIPCVFCADPFITITVYLRLWQRW